MAKARSEEPVALESQEPQDLRAWLGITAVALVGAGSYMIFGPDSSIGSSVAGVATDILGFAAVLKACGVNVGELIN